MKTILSCFFMLITLFINCENKEDDTATVVTECDFTTLVSEDEYASAESDDFLINSLEVNEDCLEITFSAGGCDGESWKTRLIDSEQILESFPIQRNLFFELKDEELCEAFITKTVSFDISELKEDSEEVILNITNADKSISTNPDNSISYCNKEAIVDAAEYAAAESDDFVINSIELIEDCLEVNFSASGCGGDSWETRLIDSEQILESFPIQRNLIFTLKNNGDCLTFLTETVSFDISGLKEGYDEVIFNITNADL